MSDILENSLMDHLQKLQCHFTWDLHGEDVDIDNVEERVNDQLVYLPDALKHRMYNLLAYLKHLKGDHEEAMIQLQKAEAQIQESNISEDTDVRRTVMYGNFAWVFYHQNQFTESSTYAEKAETILKQYESPPEKNTLLSDIYGEQGWTYLSFIGKYYQQAVECFEKALELSPEDPELNSGHAMAVYRLEMLSFSSNNTENKSVPLLERAVRLNPRDTVVKVLLALKYLDMKNYDQGAILIEQALQEQPESPYVLRYVAKCYIKNRRINEAIAMFKKVLSLTPNSSSVHYELAKCYKILIKMPTCYNKQQKSEAIENAIFHLEKAVALNRLFVPAHILLAQVYIKGNQHQKSKVVFDKTLIMNNISPEQKQELNLSWAQHLKNSRRSKSEAVRHYKEVIEIQSLSLFRETAIKELESLAETIIVQNPMDATGHALLGYIHQQRGQDI
ncbi:interferon-induced protein with tetratricopeptide repeats 5-like [Rana temporaria]|uniref:interferon-induced protein with tetratricopeptide repeats 5-like n=1 Tax=Rana temporaria TaxID=8407 RepID=UPI001AADFD42|nr:interferon-induced protein with tetratricopeptide repeats 5-like [Rana temporaria]